MATIPTEPATVTTQDLLACEAAVGDAISRRDVSDIKVLGFGEISVAVGWPTGNPTMVMKRGAVYANRDTALRDQGLVVKYIDALIAAGVTVLPTEAHLVERPDGMFVPYLVQPLVPKELLAESTIARDEPSPDHPLLLAVRDLTVDLTTPTLGADIQITNFAWDDTKLVLIDVGTPIQFNDDGSYPDVSKEITVAVPAFLRKPIVSFSLQIIGRYTDRRESFSMFLELLHRIDQARWVPAAAAVFNPVINEPLALDEIEKNFGRLHRVVPVLNRMAMLQRWWTTKVRRKPYEFFVMDSFTGQVL